MGGSSAKGEPGHSPEMDVDAEGDDSDYVCGEEGGESDDEIVDDPMVEPDELPLTENTHLVEDISNHKCIAFIHSFSHFYSET